MRHKLHIANCKLKIHVIAYFEGTKSLYIYLNKCQIMSLSPLHYSPAELFETA